jgi:hypothetical protein
VRRTISRIEEVAEVALLPGDVSRADRIGLVLARFMQGRYG